MSHLRYGPLYDPILERSLGPGRGQCWVSMDLLRQGKLNGKVKVTSAYALNGAEKSCNFQHLLQLPKG